MRRKGGKRHEISGGHAWGNQGKLTRRGHPDHTRGTRQTRHHFAINVPNTKHEATDNYVPTLSQRQEHKQGGS